MARTGGAKDQKRLAKQKAKRAAKQKALHLRASKDPAVRLQHTEKWPIVQALVGQDIWKKGIGHLLIARRDTAGDLVYATFLVDVYCLGVKNAFWRCGTPAEIEQVVRKIEKFEAMREAAPACLAKIVTGAVEFAQSLGFAPHPDFRHASKLLNGIDPSTCPDKFQFGHNGRPYYIQGPNESPAEAEAITRIMQNVGGDFLVEFPRDDEYSLDGFGPESDEIDELESFGDDSDEDDLPVR